MSHVRQQIRDAVVSLLKASNPSRWSYVYNTRIHPNRDVFPYILVHIPSEISEDYSIHPSPILNRDLNLITAAYIKIPGDPEDFEDSLDNIAVDIENRITFSEINSALSSGYIKGLFLTNTDTQIITDDDGRTYAETALTWRIQVMTQGDPETLT